MNIKPFHELPIRSKLQMLDDIVKIIHFLHAGERPAADRLIEDLKARAMLLDTDIQQAVLIFAEQVCFQFDYDPFHKVTSDIQNAADTLIKKMGFSDPPK